MGRIKILWLDDDSTSKGSAIIRRLLDDGHEVSEIELEACNSCDKAATTLEQYRPDWAIIDLTVTRGSWSYGEVPAKRAGVDFIKYLRHLYHERIGIIVFTVIVNTELENVLAELNVVSWFIKSQTAFASVLNFIIEQEKHGISRTN